MYLFVKKIVQEEYRYRIFNILEHTYAYKFLIYAYRDKQHMLIYDNFLPAKVTLTYNNIFL